jgi:NADH-quinone oxidoreductase subunit L
MTGVLVVLAFLSAVGGFLSIPHFLEPMVALPGVKEGFAGLYRVLSNKYYVDELYDRAINRPLLWISDSVFLKVGDRMLIDGTLNGLAGLAQRAAGRLSRVQTGSLHKYAFMVLVGMVASLVWMWRNG